MNKQIGREEVLAWGGMLLLFILAKSWYAGAEVAQLDWILRPTAWFVSVLTGDAYHLIAQRGYVRWDGQVVIHKGCAGFHFVLLTMGLAWILLGPALLRRRRVWQMLCFGLLIPYAVGVFANVSRIVVALSLDKLPIHAWLTISPSGLHLTVGILTYLVLLVLLSLAMQRYRDAIERPVDV